MEDYIVILFLIIFFVGPLVKKIVEALSGRTPLPKRPSREDVKDYLDKMRSSTQQSRPQPAGQYRPPATQPTSAQISRQPVEREYTRSQEQMAKSSKKQTYAKPSKQVREPERQTLVQAEAKKELAHKEAIFAAQQASKTGPRRAFAYQAPQKASEGLQKRVLTNPDLTDLQKAIALQTIFSKPKSLQNLLVPR